MLLLAQEQTKPLFEFTTEPLWRDSGIPLAVMGIFVVFSALLLVVFCISTLPRALNLISPSAAKSEPQAASSSAVAADEDELPEETLVVIAAAVAEVLDRPHRIVKIRGLSPTEQAWSIEGRMKHHLSHRIQRRDHK